MPWWTSSIAQCRGFGDDQNWRRRIIGIAKPGIRIGPRGSTATLKIFLTATVAARAQRRFLEQQAKGISMSLEEVAADIQRRDTADSTRAVAPLRKADDAIEVDSSDMTLDEVVASIVDLWRSKVLSPES